MRFDAREGHAPARNSDGSLAFQVDPKTGEVWLPFSFEAIATLNGRRVSWVTADDFTGLVEFYVRDTDGDEIPGVHGGVLTAMTHGNIEFTFERSPGPGGLEPPIPCSFCGDLLPTHVQPDRAEWVSRWRFFGDGREIRCPDCRMKYLQNLPPPALASERDLVEA